MKKLTHRFLFTLLLLFTSLRGASPAPNTNTGIALDPFNNFAFLHINAGGALLLASAGISNPAVPAPKTNAGVALDPNNNFAFLHVDASGNLITNSAVVATGINVTWTGSWTFPFVVVMQGPGVLIPEGTASGPNTYSGMPGPVINGLNYSESSGLTNIVPGTLLTVSFNDLVGATGAINISNCLALTSVSFPALVFTGFGNNFGVNGAPLLTTLSIPSLQYVGNDFTPATDAALTTLSAPALIGCHTFSPSAMASLTTFNFPAMKYIEANYQPSTMGALTNCSADAVVYVGGLYAPTTMALCTTLSNSSLATIGGNFAPTTMAALTTLSFPALARVMGTGGIIPTSMTAVTTVSFPALVDCEGPITFTGFGNITTVTLGTISTTLKIAGNITFNGNKLTNASENQLLGVVASLSGSGGTTAYHFNVNIAGGTNATPDTTGLAFIATIVTNGGTVTHN